MPSATEVAERVWYGADALASMARGALAPAAALYGAAIARRNAGYDRGEGVVRGAIPALSVGNLTVGGTGKTPVSAWFVAQSLAAGARPALVLRGYGDDEPAVHARLNPAARVIADADRVAGIAAAARAGCDCAVLDDAFQHRRAAREVDVVLVSVDRWRDDVRLLPAGPFREPLAALARASLVVLTEKAPPPGARERVRAAVSRVTRAPVAVVSLAAGRLRPLTEDASADAGASRPLASLAGRRVLAVSAIGDPGAFHRQLAGAGLTVAPLVFPDHHVYTSADVTRIVAAAGDAPVVCTLKDAVKLAPRWPAGGAPAAWYLWQHVVPVDGAEALSAAVRALLAARGPSGGVPSSP